MATQGTVHLFSLTTGTITDATVMAFSKSREFGYQETTPDEDGDTIEWRGGDEMTTGSITLRPRSGYTVDTIGTAFTYDSVNWIVESVAEEYATQTHVVITVNLKSYDSITPS